MANGSGFSPITNSRRSPSQAAPRSFCVTRPVPEERAGAITATSSRHWNLEASSRSSPQAGGHLYRYSKLNPGEFSHRWPQVLPGSQAILFTTNTHGSNYDDANIEVISLKTGERKTVERGGYSPRYLATSNGTGHLIYLHQSTLFAVPFAPGHLAATGSPVPVLYNVSGDNVYGGNYSFAEASSGLGTFVYLSGNGQGTWSISWVDSSGDRQPLHTPPGRYFTPRFSPTASGWRFRWRVVRGKTSG